MNDKIKYLIDKGVKIFAPASIEIGDEVDLERISCNTAIHAGCKIFGKETYIMPDVRLGYEGPVTIDNCYIARNVALDSGYFCNSIFLEGSKMGSSSHVREGTILEEQASGAHTVGLKQTILFPFVTLGSLINFCDCMMTGGTGRKNHSEVGSSYIHFNYTPNQDKATPSLMGNVFEGVMLDQPPIFLGGQGGLVGPIRLAFGTVIAAGSIYRKDEFEKNLLLIDTTGTKGKMAYNLGMYRSIKRVMENNFYYIANLIALFHWYRYIRAEFVSVKFPKQLLDGLIKILTIAFKERLKRLEELSEKMPYSIQEYKRVSGAESDLLLTQKRQFHDQWHIIKDSLQKHWEYCGDTTLQERFVDIIKSRTSQDKQQSTDNDYIRVVQALTSYEKEIGVKWLKGIAVNVCQDVSSLFPTLKMEFKIL